MGYTHYWRLSSKPTRRDWAKFIGLAEEAVRLTGIPVAFEYDQPSVPAEFSSSRVWFNGIGDGGAETFVLENKPDESFCKTYRREYDTAVVACLFLAKRCLTGFEWSSDGELPDFLAGLAVADNVLDSSARGFPVASLG
jgi:hypothetical protein